MTGMLSEASIWIFALQNRTSWTYLPITSNVFNGWVENMVLEIKPLG